eukprot:4538249-Amphidinium_carterae.1
MQAAPMHHPACAAGWRFCMHLAAPERAANSERTITTTLECMKQAVRNRAVWANNDLTDINGSRTYHVHKCAEVCNGKAPHVGQQQVGQGKCTTNIQRCAQTYHKKTNTGPRELTKTESCVAFISKAFHVYPNMLFRDGQAPARSSCIESIRWHHAAQDDL